MKIFQGKLISRTQASWVIYVVCPGPRIVSDTIEVLHKYLLNCEDEGVHRKNYLNVTVMETSRILISRYWETGQTDTICEFKNIIQVLTKD